MNVLQNSAIYCKSRPMYKRYRDAKDAHKKAVRQFIKLEEKLMIVAKECLQSTVDATIRKAVHATLDVLFDEETVREIVIDERIIGRFPKRFLNAKDRYNGAIANLIETLETQDRAEEDYFVTIIEILEEEYGFSQQKISDLFGIVHSTLSIKRRVVVSRMAKTEENCVIPENEDCLSI